MEKSGIGLQFSNIGTIYYNYSVGTAIYMLLISFFVGLIVGIYLNNVLPSKDGSREPWNYLFKPSYWKKQKKGTCDLELNSL